MRKTQAIRLIKEINKHAKRDNCYECKQLLRVMGFNPDKTFEEYFEGGLKNE